MAVNVMTVKKGQMKIQQMAFMIVALFFFFTLVGLFFLNIMFKDIGNQADRLAKSSAISSLEVVANMPEFACSSHEELCLDEDKLLIMSGSLAQEYESFWPVASISVRILVPNSTQAVLCPAANCNYYSIFDSGQQNKKEHATFVSVCKFVKEQNYVQEVCRPAKLLVGVRDE